MPGLRGEFHLRLGFRARRLKLPRPCRVVPFGLLYLFLGYDAYKGH